MMMLRARTSALSSLYRNLSSKQISVTPPRAVATSTLSMRRRMLVGEQKNYGRRVIGIWHRQRNAQEHLNGVLFGRVLANSAAIPFKPHQCILRSSYHAHILVLLCRSTTSLAWELSDLNPPASAGAAARTPLAYDISTRTKTNVKGRAEACQTQLVDIRPGNYPQLCT
jgi:hypothetical protein